VLIGIQPDRMGEQSYSEKWSVFLQDCGVDFEFIDLLGLEDLSLLRRYDGIMWRWDLSHPWRQVAPRILDAIEKELRIPVYPDYNTRWPWDDKIKQHYLLGIHGIRTPRTWIFWHREDARNWIRETEFPKIFKLAVGASSRNVVLVNDRREASRLVDRMFSRGISTAERLDEVKSGRILRPFARNVRGRLFARHRYEESRRKAIIEKNYAYFQEFVPGNPWDTRVTVIGDSAFGFRRINRPGDFRASGSGRIDFDRTRVDLRMVEHAFSISEKLKVDCMAYDFLKDKKGEILLLEMCWTFADSAVQKCPGHWDRSLAWHPGSAWAEEFQIKEFLARIRSGCRPGPPGPHTSGQVEPGKPMEKRNGIEA